MMSLRKLYYWLPPNLRIFARKIFFFPTDLIERLKGNSELIPPKGLIYTGGGDFAETGQRFLKFFIEYGGLKKDDRVMDIGSGIGRLAIPLSGYLSDSSEYHGFDLIAQGINWCKENISSSFSHFHFHQIHLKNDLYTSEGSDPTQFIFPLDANSQDFIFLISVFTHLVPNQMEHYISEISRLLKPNQTCFATFFIHDDSIKEMNKNFDFKHRRAHYSLMDKTVTSANVAFEKEYLFSIFESNNLSVTNYFPGHWRNPTSTNSHLDFQDIIILKKKV